ncbi:MAG: hypothetical protein ORN28_01725, partial [Rhodoferax sp.]|nr:hypothetical protein [Rhodoferax sp.]
MNAIRLPLLGAVLWLSACANITQPPSASPALVPPVSPVSPVASVSPAAPSSQPFSAAPFTTPNTT